MKTIWKLIFGFFGIGVIIIGFEIWQLTTHDWMGWAIVTAGVLYIVLPNILYPRVDDKHNDKMRTKEVQEKD